MHQPIPHPQEKTAQLVWTAFILMFFVLQAILWTFAISMTAGDSSHAVVAGYDEQALRWDEVKKLQQSSDILGWHCILNVDSSADIHENRVVTLQLLDRENGPVSNASMNVKAFHRGAAAEVQLLKFKEVASGVYSTSVRISKFGKWRFSGSATVGDSNFLIEQQTEVTTPTGANQNSVGEVGN